MEIQRNCAGEVTNLSKGNYKIFRVNCEGLAKESMWCISCGKATCVINWLVLDVTPPVTRCKLKVTFILTKNMRTLCMHRMQSRRVYECIGCMAQNKDLLLFRAQDSTRTCTLYMSTLSVQNIPYDAHMTNDTLISEAVQRKDRYLLSTRFCFSKEEY